MVVGHVCLTDPKDVAHDVHAYRVQERLGERAGHDACGRLTGARAFEHVTCVVERVLLHAREIGVTRTRCGEALARRPGRRGHLFLPLGPLGVQDLDGDGRTKGAAVAHATDDAQHVTLKAHPRAAPVSQSSASQLVTDRIDVDGETRGQALDDHAERRTMTLTSG